MVEKQIVLVSVVCITYNQEKYISQCVESLLDQETSFNYEIIIHDDCSSDTTRDILKKYEQMYSDKITLILQDQNQYSNGINILDDIIIPMTNGEYIAICEGDDYWTDRHKLQKQIDALNENTKCWICAHAVDIISEDNTKKLGKIAPSEESCIFDVSEVIEGDGGFVGTNSLVFRREIFNCQNQFRKMYPLDYFLQIMGALHGGMAYLPDVMSAYRSCSNGSWTNSLLQDKEKFCYHFYKVIKSLEKLDEETQGNYHEVIYDRIKHQRCEIIRLKDDYKQLLKKENRDIVNDFLKEKKIKVIIKIIFSCIGRLNKKKEK